MNKKIYNKKGFWSGVFFLLLAVVYIILLVNNWNDMNSIRNGKSILFAIICALIGISQIYRGLDSKCAKEDAQDDDERKKLVILKTESSTYKITFNISIVLTLLLAVAIGVTENDDLLGVFVGVAIMPTIMIISYMFANHYHNKHN
ncbi:hypothetical protein KPL37_13655 [Clostridium frigoris]|uniref:DUF2178 domain-containing protein n=1 Tax=Clostridium frigoris TaxID=205327 RepID=A0ABS6BV34_9CLOT|nr:hypothetical protein [Clostridium frigoris]MBU3160786.1 hypothetical protein [Clostridium frigoris]